MSGARPRRSGAATSFQIQFPDLPGSSDEEDESGVEQPDGENGNENGDAANANNGEDDDDDEDGIEIDSSGSEYAPAVIKDKDGTLVEDVPSDDEDDVTDLEDADPEEDDADSAAGEKELDDISIATSAGLSEDSEGGTRGQGLKHGRARAGFKDTPAMRVVGRTPMALMAGSGGLHKKAVPRRSGPSGIARGTAAKTTWYDLTYTQSYAPPRTCLSESFGHPVHSPSSNLSGGIEDRGLFNEASAQKVVKRSAYLPFGPHWSTCEDFAYHKGKHLRRPHGPNGDWIYEKAARWGGWWNQSPLSSDNYTAVTDIGRVIPHLPRNIYPAIPSSLHLTAAAEGDGTKAEDIDADGNEDQWEAPNTGGGSNMAEMFKAANGQQAPLPPRHPSGDAHSDDGIFRINVGLVGDLKAGDERLSNPTALQTQIEIDRFTCIRLDSYLSKKPGFMLNVGGPVCGLDWAPQPDDDRPAPCEYLAISTVSEHPAIVSRRPSDDSNSQALGMIQIWSLDTTDPTDFDVEPAPSGKGRGLRLDLAILTESEMLVLKWCPKGGSREGIPATDSRLGLLAALTADGRLEVYDIPYPPGHGVPQDDLLFLEPKKPRLTFNLGTVPVSHFEWLSQDAIIAACSNGYVALFHTSEPANPPAAPAEQAQQAGQRQLKDADTIEPSAYFWVHETPITSIAVIRQPMLNGDGSDNIESDPCRVATSALDGSTKMIDFDDIGNIINFGFERSVRSVISYQPALGAVLYPDADLGIRCTIIKPREFGTTVRIASMTGPIKDIACSDFHTFAAVAGSDGVCAVLNPLRRIKRGSHALHLLNKLYRLDFERKTGTYRMIDNIMPDSRVTHEPRGAAKKKKKKQEEAQDEETPADMHLSIAWPVEVAVNRVAWTKSLRKCHLLASGMACGLVRVDVVSGSWSAEASVNLQKDAGAGDADSD